MENGPLERNYLLWPTFGVNRSTIVMAFDELVAKGYIEGNGRKGTIVVNNNENASTYAPIGSLM